MGKSEQPERTFAFADLAGFTALTEAHGDERAAVLAEDYCATVDRLAHDHRAHTVKTIGDAVMLCAEDAAEAVRLGLRVVSEIGRRHGFLAVRVGMHTGTAVERQGDWFGATVNVAARVSAMASGGEVLLSDQTRLSAGELDGVVLTHRGPHSFKNVGMPVHVYAAWAEGELSEGLAIDPVCRMAVQVDRVAGTLVHGGVQHHFCSLGCAGAFAAHPDRYAGMTRSPQA